MKAEEIRTLPIGTRVRGKLGNGTISVSNRYGKGVRLDNWNYSFEDDIHGVLDAQGAYADQRHQYLDYASALNKSQDQLDFLVDLIREHQILRNRFEGRGLDASILDAIDQLIIYRTD